MSARKKEGKQWFIWLAIIGGLLLSCPIVWGQATARATIEGTIADETGAVISSAEVALINKETGAARSAQPNEAGEYRFDGLGAGFYRIKVTAAGFAAAEASKVELLVGRTATQNFALKPGVASETVEVTAAAPLVDQTKTDVSTNITPSQIEELPLISRDIADLAYLAPGVKAADAYDPTKTRYSILSVNGQAGRNVNVTVNGIDNKDNTVGGPVMQLPAEAVQEFQVSTQRFSAVNGRSEGAAINVITKSGSNGIHGSAFGFFGDQAFNAAQKLPDPANNDSISSTPDYSRRWFGGSIGGPVKKDTLFAFFAMEHQREDRSIAESPQALTQLNLLRSLGAQPAATIPTSLRENRIAGRADWTINSKHGAYLSVATQANHGLNDLSSGTSDLTDGNSSVSHMQIATFTLNSQISPIVFNQFTAGWQYGNNLIESNTRAPLITFPNGVQFGTNANVPQQSIQRKWQLRDDLVKTVGRHTFKTGVDYIWTPFMGGYYGSNGTLEIDFAASPSCVLGLPPDTATFRCGKTFFPNGFATPGAVSAMSVSVGDPKFSIKNANQVGSYFQDDWKIARGLTANLGLRWDKDFDFISGSDIGNSRTYQELRAAAPYSALAASLVRRKAKDESRNFSPRVGIAYDLNGSGKHVVRAGFGMYYGNIFQSIPLFMEQQSNPAIFQQAFSLSATNGDIVPGTNIQLSKWRYGVDPMPTIPAASSSLLPGAAGRLMDPNYRSPVTEQFNTGYTWALNSKSVIEAEYVHVLSLHENQTINVDPNIPVTPYNITTTQRTGVAGGFKRPLDTAFTSAGVPVLGSVLDDQSIGRSQYAALNISYRQRGFHGIDLIANYTLAKAQGYDEDGSSFRHYPRDPQQVLSPADLGPAFNDERHHLTLAGIATLRWGMEVAPIIQVGSARPYNAVSSRNMLNLGAGSAAGPLLLLNSDPNDLLATSLPTSLALAQCYYGGGCHLAPYNNLRGNPYFNVDTRVAKNISLGEHRNLQLAFQGFNIFNHANYGNNFGANVSTPSIFARPIGFTNPSSTTLPRSFEGEFGARFTF